MTRPSERGHGLPPDRHSPTPAGPPVPREAEAAPEHDPEQRVGILVLAYIALGFLGAVGMLVWVVTTAGR